LERLIPELARGNGRKRERKAFSNQLGSLFFSIIQASQLNRHDVRLSLKNNFRGKLRHRKTELQEFTSIALFMDDVERLLRDMYGDINSDALTDLVWAMTSMTRALSCHLLPDLEAEHEAACCADMGAGRALLPEERVTTRMVRDGIEAAEILIGRVRTVLSAQSEYGRYTVGFANALNKYWTGGSGMAAAGKKQSGAIAKLQIRCKP
jgi:hypothetical protein